MTLISDLKEILKSCADSLPIDGSSHSAGRVKTLAEFLCAVLRDELEDHLLVAVQDLIPERDKGQRLGYDAPLADRQAQLEAELKSWAKRCADGEYKARPGFVVDESFFVGIK